MNNEIKQRIRSLRQAKGWSQREIASRLCISQAAYQKLEAGDTVLNVEHLVSIAGVLGITVSALMFGVEYRSGAQMR